MRLRVNLISSFTDDHPLFGYVHIDYQLAVFQLFGGMLLMHTFKSYIKKHTLRRFFSMSVNLMEKP